LTRLAAGRSHRAEGYCGGIEENAPPIAADAAGGQGTLDSATNFFATGVGKLAVRGGSQVKQTLASANKVLYLRPFTPVGAIAVAHTDISTKHKLWRLTTDVAFFTGTEATSTHDLSWDKATPARPVGAELYEKMFIADATVDYSARKGLVCVDGAGTVTPVAFDFGGGSETLKPYVCEEFNNHLFIAGYENKTLSADAPATIRHSYLGVSPEAVGGFDTLAYLYCGAKGQRVTGMKKGRGLMLVAKNNELYRITGFGIAKPGWTFAIEMVQTTQGLGVSNPYALCYAAGSAGGPGYWYGIGEAGPFRSDGFSAEFLGLPRAASWNKITNLAYAWVIYHPDRNVVLFGMNQTPVPAGRSVTYPTVAWIWDCQRERWISDIAMSADMTYASAIPSVTTTFSPSTAPTSLAFTHFSAGLTTVAATWTNGDATASTEIWVRDINSGGTSALWSTAAPAATSATITGLVAGTNYAVKIRHIKSGIGTAYAQATTTVSSPAGALASAVTIPITALPGTDDIPNGTVLTFSGGSLATLTATAHPTDTSLAVVALDVAVSAGATAPYVTTEVDAFTLLPPPVLSVYEPAGNIDNVSSDVSIDHGTINTEQNAVVVDQQTITAIGRYTYYNNTAGVDTWRSNIEDLDWPSGITSSVYSNAVTI